MENDEAVNLPEHSSPQEIAHIFNSLFFSSKSRAAFQSDNFPSSYEENCILFCLWREGQKFNNFMTFESVSTGSDSDNVAKEGDVTDHPGNIEDSKFVAVYGRFPIYHETWPGQVTTEETTWSGFPLQLPPGVQLFVLFEADIERVVAAYLIEHLKKKMVLPTNQSAYRPNHSPETALLAI